MSEIENCIDIAIQNIDTVLNDIYNLIELDNSAHSAMYEVSKELRSIKSTLTQFKTDIQTNAGVIDTKRSYLGI